MIEYYNYNAKKGLYVKVPEYVKGCWMNVVNPSVDEISFLEKEFDLCKENIKDGIDIHENPRFEIEDKKTYIYLTAPTSKIMHEHDSSFLVIYAKDQFIVISKEPIEILDNIFNPKFSSKKVSSSRNLVRILRLLSSMFESSVHKVLKDAKRDRASIKKLKNRDMIRLINDEEKLNAYISSFAGNISTYSRIFRDKNLTFLKDEKETIEDLIIDMNESMTVCEQTSKTISNMRSYYSTKLSNDINETIRLLTIVTIFISIPTFITSFYGMNIVLPFQTHPHLLLYLGTLIVFVYAILFWFLRKRV